MFRQNNDPTPQYFKNFASRRRSLFVSLFKDDVDPYTLVVSAREKCLIKTSEDKVLFLSGEGKNWAGCDLVARPTNGVRTWLECKDSAMEITIQAPLGADQQKTLDFPQIECL